LSSIAGILLRLEIFFVANDARLYSRIMATDQVTRIDKSRPAEVGHFPLLLLHYHRQLDEVGHFPLLLLHYHRQLVEVGHFPLLLLHYHRQLVNVLSLHVILLSNFHSEC
jgi:hypothetical protein